MQVLQVLQVLIKTWITRASLFSCQNQLFKIFRVNHFRIIFSGPFLLAFYYEVFVGIKLAPKLVNRIKVSLH